MNKTIFQINDFVDIIFPYRHYANGWFGCHVHTFNLLYSTIHTRTPANLVLRKSKQIENEINGEWNERHACDTDVRHSTPFSNVKNERRCYEWRWRRLPIPSMDVGHPHVKCLECFAGLPVIVLVYWCECEIDNDNKMELIKTSRCHYSFSSIHYIATDSPTLRHQLMTLTTINAKLEMIETSNSIFRHPNL